MSSEDHATANELHRKEELRKRRRSSLKMPSITEKRWKRDGKKKASSRLSFLFSHSGNAQARIDATVDTLSALPDSDPPSDESLSNEEEKNTLSDTDQLVLRQSDQDDSLLLQWWPILAPYFHRQFSTALDRSVPSHAKLMVGASSNRDAETVEKTEFSIQSTLDAFVNAFSFLRRPLVSSFPPTTEGVSAKGNGHFLREKAKKGMFIQRH